MLAALNKHAYLFLLWTRRDLASRYAGSVAGIVWAVVQPLATILIFYVVFALILKIRIPELAAESGYFLYLLCGLLPWLSIAEGLSRAGSSLVSHEQFLQRVVFPVDILPASAIVGSLLPQLIGTVVLLVLVVSAGELSWLRLLAWPLVFGCQLVMLLGLGCGLAILSVHLRDIAQALPVILQVFFYATPILYPKSMIPAAYHDWYLVNPLSGLIEAYQWVFLGLPLPAAVIASLVFWTLLLGLGGYWLFRVLRPTLGDYL